MVIYRIAVMDIVAILKVYNLFVLYFVVDHPCRLHQIEHDEWNVEQPEERETNYSRHTD